MRDNILFYGTDWHRQIEAQWQGMRSKIGGLSQHALSQKTDEQLESEIYDACKLEIPEISEGDITVSSAETTVRGYRALQITVHIPFEGDRDMFGVTPPTYTSVFPRGEIRGKEIVFSLIGTDFETNPPKPRIDKDIDLIKQYLDWQRGGLGDFHDRLRSEIRRHLKERRAEIASNASVIDSLGFKRR